MKVRNPPRIAYFVTPHGFGHAARSAAVMQALGRRVAGARLEIVTTVPEWFFAQSLTVEFEMSPVASDVGLIHFDPLREDLVATVAALDAFWRKLAWLADEILERWQHVPPQLVVSDISPLGLEVARRAGVPSVLVENFTWDWIYSGYRERAPRLERFGERYADLVETADYHFQCRPTCRPQAGAVSVPPVSRDPAGGRESTRRALGLDADDQRPLILLTMGGFGWGRLTASFDERYILVTLGGVEELSREGDLIRLPDRSPVYPPDLVWASDVVIAKLGYSTIAECFRAGTRLGFITRPEFPESGVLEEFVRNRLPAVEIECGASPSDPSSVDLWRRRVEELLDVPRAAERSENGADEIAAHLQAVLGFE